MMIPFCDVCGKEITKDNAIPPDNPHGNGWYIEFKFSNHKHLTRVGQPGETGTITVFKIENVSEGENHKDVCRYCLIDALNKLDNRPKEAAAQIPGKPQ